MTILAGRVALVTGASHGALAAAGAQVAVHYRSDRAATEVLTAAIRAAGGVTEAFGADVARTEEVRRLRAEVELCLGALGIVVNTADRSATPRSANWPRRTGTTS